MHPNSMTIMEEFINNYGVKNATVVDIGSYDVNGRYRELFTGKYIGVDIIPGPNVDIIMDSEEWNKLKNIDVVISGQTIEHVADIPKLMNSIYQVLKPGGILCIIAPSEGPRHDYPIWVGNFSKERMTEVVEDARFEVISCTISPVLPFNDNCCIAKKPEVKQKQIEREEIRDEDNE